jgi:hypothetical protein
MFIFYSCYHQKEQVDLQKGFGMEFYQQNNMDVIHVPGSFASKNWGIMSKTKNSTTARGVQRISS